MENKEILLKHLKAMKARIEQNPKLIGGSNRMAGLCYISVISTTDILIHNTFEFYLNKNKPKSKYVYSSFRNKLLKSEEEQLDVKGYFLWPLGNLKLRMNWLNKHIKILEKNE